MILKIFSVKDKIVEAFLQPFFSPTIGSAIRSLTEVVNDPQSPFAKNPHDYTLYQIGEFDDWSGQVTPMDSQRLVPLADLVKVQ